MHLFIKTENSDVKQFYINHSTYHEGDAGLDLFVPETTTIKKNSISNLVDMKISIQALDDSKSKGLSFFMHPRSSMGSKTPLRLANSSGIIDRDYRGILMGCFDNISNSEDYTIQKGDRLLQLLAPNLEPITFELVDELSETKRGIGGYGSTGK